MGVFNMTGQTLNLQTPSGDIVTVYPDGCAEVVSNMDGANEAVIVNGWVFAAKPRSIYISTVKGLEDVTVERGDVLIVNADVANLLEVGGYKCRGQVVSPGPVKRSTGSVKDSTIVIGSNNNVSVGSSKASAGGQHIHNYGTVGVQVNTRSTNLVADTVTGFVVYQRLTEVYRG